MVRHSVASYLRNELPPLINVANRQWETHIPQIGEVKPYPPKELRHRDKPLLAVTLGPTSGFHFLGNDPDGQPVFDAVYQIKIWVWCFTPELPNGQQYTAHEQIVEATEQARDRLIGLTRILLFRDVTLGTDYTEIGDYKAIKETYSETIPVPNMSGRLVAAACLEFPLTVTETVLAPPLGVAETTNLETEVMEHDCA